MGTRRRAHIMNHWVCFPITPQGFHDTIFFIKMDALRGANFLKRKYTSLLSFLHITIMDIQSYTILW
jgi:hypothetical protein